MFVAPQRTGPARPSLSEQLAKIGKGASGITDSIRDTFGLESQREGALRSSAARAFVVGHLSSRMGSPVRFFGDRVEYTFHHPFEQREVAMTMFFRDMRAAVLKGSAFSFRIPHRLVHFGNDYDPGNPSHALVIELSTGADAAWVRDQVLPAVRKSGQAGAWKSTSTAVGVVQPSGSGSGSGGGSGSRSRSKQAISRTD